MPARRTHASRARSSRTVSLALAGSFADIGKAASDLLSKDFTTGRASAELKASVPLSRCVFTASGASAAGMPGGSLQAELRPVRGLLAKLACDASGAFSPSVEAQLLPALKLTLAARTKGAPGPPPSGCCGGGSCGSEAEGDGCPIVSASVAADLSTPMLSARCEFERISQSGSGSVVLPPSAWLPLTGLPLTAGLSVGFDGKSGALTSKGFKLACTRPAGYSLAAYASQAGSARSVGLSLHHALPLAGLQLATDLRRTAGRTQLGTAVAYALDPTTTAKARVDSDAMVALSCKHRLSPKTTLTLAGRLDLNGNPHKTQYGMHLAIAP
jgi:hypothetical protein